MNKLKKVLSLFLAVSMISSLVQVSTFATDSNETSTARGKVNMVYLGTGTGKAAEDNPSVQDLPDTADWVANATTGTVFWVGITLSDMQKMDQTASSDDDRSSHFSNYANEDAYDWTGAGGIFNVAVGIEYASKYIKPTYVSDTQMKNNAYYPAIMKKLDARYANYTVDANNVAADIAPETSGGDPTGREPSVIKSEDLPKLVYASMTTTGDITTNIFGWKDNITNDPVYIMAIPFRLIEKPAPGTKVLQAALNPTNFIIQTGSSAEPFWGAQWNSNRTVTPTNNLQNHLDYTGNLDLFPGGTTQTGIKVTGNKLAYKDMEDIASDTFTVNKVLESGDGAEIADYKYYYGPTNSKVGESVTKSLTGLTEIKTTETDTWQNGVPKAANGQCLYIVAGEYMWNVGVLSVEDASITGLKNGSLTDGFTSKVVGVDNISFTGGQVTAVYNNGNKEKAIQFADFGTNNLAVYRKDGTTYTEIPATGSTVKFAANNAIYIATKDASNKKEVSVKNIAGTAVTTTYSIATQPKTAYTYPETLDISSLVIKVTSTDPSLAGNKTLSEAQVAGIFDTVKIGTETVTAGTTKITKAHANKTIDFYKGTTKVAGLSSSKITFTPKEVTLTATAAGITKEYNGNDTVSGTITYGVTGLEAGDTAGTISGLTAKYASTDVENDIAITIAGTPASNNADFNNKYTFATTMPTNVKGNITKKALTNLTFTVTASQNVNQSGPYTIPDGNFDLAAANGKVGSDDVKIKHTGGTISEENMKNGVTDASVTDMTCELDGAKKGNYSLGIVTVKATVTNLPVIKALPQATLDAIAAATKNGANNWKASDEKTLDQLKAALPTSAANVADDKGGKHAVTIAWAIDPADTTLNAKGGTYTFKGTVTTADDVLINLDTPLTATIVVDAVTVTAADANVKTSYTVGDTAEALPATATITAGGQTLTLPITWSPATVDTSADNSEAGGTKYTATIDYTDKEWLTVPSTFETIEKTIVVSDKPLTVVNSVKDAPADITINAGNEKNQPDNKLAELLPNKLTVIDADNNEVEVDVEWATTDTYDVKGGEYTYTATFKTEGYDYSAVSGDKAPTVKIKVDAVTLGYDSKIFDAKTVNTGSKISLTTSGTAILTPSVDGVNVPYTVTWTPDPTSADTSAAATLKFTGTVAFDQTVLDANPWLTVPTELSKEVTVTVKKKSSGGGGGGTSAYTVKFSAGKYGKITEGKTSVSIVKGKKVEKTSLPTVTPNEGYKFLGWSTDGKTVIDPTADAVSKGVTYTALYEEIVEPTPTPTPTPIIDKNYTKPYASGYDDGMFLPNDYITRAELASMIARLSYGDDIPDSYRASFPDVDDTWYNKYIGYLEDKNVLSGYEDGTFRPNQTVTRGEMCAVIARAQKYDLISVDDMFSDVTDADWAKAYITTLASKSVVSGYEDGTFGTYSPITRAETVAIINRILEPSTAIITFTPLDIAGHWAEADILLAVNEREIKGAVTEPTATPEATPEATVEPETTDKPEATTEPTETPAA